MSIHSPTSSSLKISICGDEKAGKTWIAACLCNIPFPLEYIGTIGVDYHAHRFPDKNQRWCIWDLAGSIRFQPLTYAYVYGAKVLLYVYDVNNKRSLEELKRRHQKYLKEKNRTELGKIIVIGAKIDKLLHNQKPEDGATWAEQIGSKHFYISAKSGKNIPELKSYLKSLLAT